MRIPLAIACLATLAGCYEIDHDPYTISALEPANIAPPLAGSLHETNVELLTGTVWQLGEERLLFFVEQGGMWRSYQVDHGGLVRVPEWSVEAVPASDAMGSIDDYEDFASNIPARFVSVPDGVIVEFAAGNLHIVSYIYLIGDGAQMAFTGRPSETVLADLGGSFDNDSMIRSTNEGIFLFDRLPATLLDRLHDDPASLFEDIENIPEEARWQATDLAVPIDLDDRLGLEALRQSL